MVQQYESDDLASNSEEGKRIRKAKKSKPGSSDGDNTAFQSR